MSKLKKELDRVVSLLVRQTEARKHDGIIYCYTCNKALTVKTAQCGHFVSRMYLATRWDLDNLRCQCVGCNVWGRGKLLDFEDNLVEEIGDVKVEFLKESRKQLCKLNREWYEKRIAYFKGLLEP
jgi:hypothetical protein